MSAAMTSSGKNALTIFPKVEGGLGTALRESQPQAASAVLASAGDTAAAVSSLLVVATCTTMSASSGALAMVLVSSLSSQNALAISTKGEDVGTTCGRADPKLHQRHWRLAETLLSLKAAC